MCVLLALLVNAKEGSVDMDEQPATSRILIMLTAMYRPLQYPAQPFFSDRSDRDPPPSVVPSRLLILRYDDALLLVPRRPGSHPGLCSPRPI